MNTDADSEENEMLLRACAGDRAAFDSLLLAHRAKLRRVIRRMVGHPDDTEDLVQETMLRAWEAMRSFRGESRFGTWLCAIGIRQAIDHLRRQKTWRAEAQVVYANECYKSDELQAEVIAVFSDPAFAYEAREHIAYCFTCVGRSLPPEEQAALVLCEVSGATNQEAARALGITESVLRHRLSAARSRMEKQYEGLCSLVNKGGVCYQCKGLRDSTPPDRQGASIPDVERFDARLDVVRGADIDTGVSQHLHDVFWRRTKAIEDRGLGSIVPESECGKG